MAGKKLINRWEATFVVSWHLFQRWQYVWETYKLFLLYHSKYLFQPWDGSGRGPWGSGDAPSWSQTAPGSSGGGQGEGWPTLIIWYSNLNFQFPGRKRKGCFDLWRWFWAWALLCRIHRWDGNVCTNAKKIKTLADLRFNLGNEKKGISNIKRKCPPGDGMLTGGVAGSVFASPPTGSWDCSKTHLVKTSLAVFASQFNYKEKIFSFHLGGDQGCC